MNPTEQAFLAAVLAAPDDDAPRLIYADWLEERGDPRGEFIRVQCALAHIPAPDSSIEPSDPEWDDQVANTVNRVTLRARSRELLRRYFGEWTDGLPEELVTKECPDCRDRGPDPETNVVECLRCECTGLVIDEDSVEFRRGFVEALTCTAPAWLQCADALTKAAPVTRVTLTTLPRLTLSGGPSGESLYRLSEMPRGGELIVQRDGSPEEHQAACARLLAAEWPRIKFTLPPDQWGMPPNLVRVGDIQAVIAESSQHSRPFGGDPTEPRLD